MRPVLLFLALALTVRADVTVEPAKLGPDARFDAARGHGFEPGGEPTADKPGFVLSFAAPEGNHRVTVVFGGDRDSDTTVRAETRRLLHPSVRVPAGGSVTLDFVVNTRDARLPAPPPNAPGAAAVRLNPREVGSRRWDDRLTLEFAGQAPAVRSITVAPADVPTLFLAGDSTVADQASGDFSSWGQMLTAEFGPGIAVANHAESGETLKSFLASLRLDKVLALARPGDWLLIQFGHNDQKAQWPQTYAEARTTFPAYLRTYLAEARRRGLQPVLVTSPQRRTFTGARVRDTHGDYPAVVRELAAAEGVPLVDLTALSTRLLEALGPERSRAAFADGGNDGTHHNAYGAHLHAAAVADALARGVPGLARHLRADRAPFDPDRPPAPEAFPESLRLR